MTTSRRPRKVLLAALLAAACSKGTAPSAPSGGDPSGGDSGPSGASGIAVPKEISALPTKSASGNALTYGSTSSALRATSEKKLAADPGTDYAEAQTFKFVDEQALSQFSIFNTIFKALGETHYADPENVNQGPYGCMVTWSEDHGGSSNEKQLVPWVVDSKMTKDADGKDENQVQVWMQMTMGDGQMHVIKVQLDIYEAPTQRADGSYSDYGVWKINAKFDETAHGYFAASCERDASGLSVIKLHEVDPKEGGPGSPIPEVKGILKRSDDVGYGIISAPSECRGPDCQRQIVTTAYAYNASHVALQQGDAVLFKDRQSAVDLVNRYGLYDATTGKDVTKSHSFGFPINYVDEQGMRHWGYYGAWQGRHQLGYDRMEPIPAGKTVTRADLPPNAPPQTFTVSDPFKGTLVKRTLVPGDVQGLKGIVVQTWVNKNFGLGWDGTKWLTCPAGSFVSIYGTPDHPNTPVCALPAMDAPPTFTGFPTQFTDLGSLVMNSADQQRQVMISYNRPPTPCDPQQLPEGQVCPSQQWTPPQQVLYVDGSFFATTWTPGSNTPPGPTGDPIALAKGDQLWVNIGGPIYISFDGAKFVKKTVLSTNQNSFMPNFDDSKDVPYALEPNFEYYFNAPGVNYVVKADDIGGYAVKVEQQTVANPENKSTFVRANTLFRQQWDNSACSLACDSPTQSTYRFDADTMKLRYVCVGSQDNNAQNKHSNDEVTNGQWGLVAYDADCANTHEQYNWDYPQGEQQGNWGTQQYLVRVDGSLVILEDPIRLESIQLHNHHGDLMTLSLQFDGNWVNGLPDIYNELQQNGWIVTPAIADKVVIIPAGTDVVDASDATKHYVFKPLQMNEYLPVIPDPGDVSVSQATGLDLSSVPTFVDAHLGQLPDVPIKYSEGKLVQ